MNPQTSAHSAEIDPFLMQFKGSFQGLLRWPELADFWEVLRARRDRDWYIYTVGEQPPERPAGATELLRFIEDTDELIKRLHKEDYCGVVYVDDRSNPTYVKIFHPKHMGYGACSLATTGPLPRWILSTLPPADISPIQNKTENTSFWGGMMTAISQALSSKGA